MILLFLLFLSTQSHAGNLALVYNGWGICVEGCAEAAANVAKLSGLEPVYVSHLTPRSTRNELFKNAKVWIQGGGWGVDSYYSMPVEMRNQIREFIHNGGGYVGFCAGAFAATLLIGESGYPGFNISVGQTYLYNKSPTYPAIMKTTWNGKIRYVYWEGGPWMRSNGAEVLNRYPTGEVATMRNSYGNGKVIITSFHPEAPLDWLESWQTDPDGLDWDIAVDMIKWSINTP